MILLYRFEELKELNENTSEKKVVSLLKKVQPLIKSG